MHRALQSLVCAAALVGCGSPTCPPPAVTLPSETESFSFTGAVPQVGLKLNGVGFDVLLDTGFDRSAFSNPDPRVDVNSVNVEWGAVKAGPMRWDLLVAPLGDNVMGNEILHQLPLVFDRAAGKIEVHPSFLKPTAGDIPLIFKPGTGCRDDEPTKGADGPFGMIVSADIEATPAFMLVDTGAEVTFVRSQIFDALTDRPRLLNVRIATGFAGNVVASAVRAKELAVDVEKSPNALLMSSPEVDKGLDDIAAKLSKACDCNRKVDGLLGWSFLREFHVDLRYGDSATARRSMRLSRKDTQDHYKRDFVGIGIYFTNTSTGLRVDAFLDPSPAKDAGVLVNDVITQINGQPAAGAVSQLGTGTSVTLTIDRAGASQQLTVPVRDLLPNPP